MQSAEVQKIYLCRAHCIDMVIEKHSAQLEKWISKILKLKL
jgi:hypothetical protein